MNALLRLGLLAIFVTGLAACDSKGEKLGAKVCECFATASTSSGNTKTLECFAIASESEGLTSDPKEYSKYLVKVQSCVVP